MGCITAVGEPRENNVVSTNNSTSYRMNNTSMTITRKYPSDDIVK